MRLANLLVPGFAARVLRVGTVAGLLSDAVLAWRGQAERARPWAPLNAPAHWVFGGPSLREDRASWRHTATGPAVHQASSSRGPRVGGRRRPSSTRRGWSEGRGAGAAGLDRFPVHRLGPGMGGKRRARPAPCAPSHNACLPCDAAAP